PVDLPPIASQGLSPAETGPHGCHLLELQPSGSAKWTLIPTAPVRWEQLSLQIDEHASRDDLIEQMLGQLEQHRPLPNEQVWLVEWRVSGLGELTLRLADPEEQQTLLSLLGQLAP